MRKARRRLWLVSPEGFRELRHACLLSRKQAAAYLGVCVRTVRHWEAGRNRVPWSVVRLLRLRRSGELGGLLDGWEGWTIWRDRLVSPDGRVFFERDMRHLWLTLTQAALFREGYDRATAGGVGAQPLRAREGVPQAGHVVEDAALPTPAAPAPAPTTAAPLPRRPAFPVLPACEKAPAEPDAGTAAGAAGGRPGAPSLPSVLVAGTGEVLRLNGATSAAGCTLPPWCQSAIRLPPAQPVKSTTWSNVAVQPLHARACASGPDSNTGLASNPEPAR